ncbi:MAG TPA: MBL fold metallo-hydrolase [Candidatus Angelobacter sp.]|nr:MBL fold metallo-hydrolase [Candidatus Angelobacter sp.]
MRGKADTILRMPTRAISFVLILFCASLALAQAPADFTVKKVGEGVYAAVSPDKSKAGSNAGFIVGSNGVVVVDTFVSPAPAKELLAEIRKVTNLPIRFVVNTHYHLDHTGGNAVFADTGATILAQRNLRGWERTENLKFFGPNPKPEDKARVESLVLPDMVYSEAVDIFLGNRPVQVRYMLGHTGGDSVVVVPDANVVFAGDLVWQKHLPNLIDATTSDWIKTLEKLLADHPSATFVSGHGDVATSQDVHDFHDYLVTLREDISKAQSEGKSGQELINAVLPQLKEKYGSWGFFDGFATRDIQQTAAELKGEKRVPQPEEAAGK